MSVLKRALAAAVLALGVGALADPAESRIDGSRRVRIDRPTVMLGSTVEPGWYTLRWKRESDSGEVKIEIVDARSVVASGKGYWVAAPRPWPYEALVYRGDGDFTELSEIRFKKSADSIRVKRDH